MWPEWEASESRIQCLPPPTPTPPPWACITSPGSHPSSEATALLPKKEFSLQIDPVESASSRALLFSCQQGGGGAVLFLSGCRQGSGVVEDTAKGDLRKDWALFTHPLPVRRGLQLGGPQVAGLSAFVHSSPSQSLALDRTVSPRILRRGRKTC